MAKKQQKGYDVERWAVWFVRVVGVRDLIVEMRMKLWLEENQSAKMVHRSQGFGHHERKIGRAHV